MSEPSQEPQVELQPSEPQDNLQPPKRPRPWPLRLAWRLFKWGSIALFLILILALIALHTDAGRAQLARLAESAASGALPGRLTIGGIHGSLLSEFSISDVALYPKEGAPVAKLGRLSLSLLAPWDGLGVRQLALTAPELDLTRLSEALPASEPSPPEPPGPPFELPDIAARVESLRIDEGKIKLSPEDTIEDLKLSASARMEERALDVKLDELSGRMKERKLPFKLSAKTTLKGEALTALSLSAAAGQMRLSVTDAALSSEAQQAKLTMLIPEGELGRALMQPNLTISTDLKGELSHPGAAAPLSLSLAGTLGGRPLSLSAKAKADLQDAELKLKLDRINPHALHRAAPPGALSLKLSAGGESLLNEARTLSAKLRLDGKLRLPKLPELKLDGDVDAALKGGERAELTAQLQTNIGQLDGKAAAQLSDPVRLRKAELSITGLRLAPLSQPGLPLDGKVNLQASAKGPVDDLSAELEAELASVRAADVSLRRAQLSAQASGLPARATGAAQLSAKGVKAPGLALSTLQLDAASRGGRALSAELSAAGRGLLRELQLSARAELGDTIRVWLDKLRVQSKSPRLELVARRPAAAPVDKPAAAPQPSAGGFQLAPSAVLAAWRQQPPSIRLRGQALTVAPLTLTSTAGAVSLAADLDLSDPLSQGGEAHVAVSGLELAAWRGLVGLPLSGALDLKADLPKGPAGPQLSVEGHALSAPELASWELSLKLRQARRRAQLALSLRSAAAGALSLSAQARTPRRLDDARAWRRLGRHALRAAALKIDRLKLAELPLVKRTAKLESGQLDGELMIGAGLSTMQGGLQVAELKSGHFPHRLDLDLKPEIGEEHSALSARLRLDGTPRLSLQLDTSASGPALSTGGLKAALAADTTLKIELPAMPLSILDLRVVPSAKQPIEGQLRLSLDATRRGGETRGSLKAGLTELLIAPKTPKLAVALRADTKPGDTEAAVAVSAKELGQLRASAALESPADPIDAKAWGKLGPASVRQASLDIQGFQLAGLVPFALVPTSLSGRVEGHAEVGAALQTATASIALSRLQISPLLAPLSAKLDLGASPTETQAELQARFGLRPMLTVAAKLDRGLPRLAAGELDGAQLDATARFPGAYLEEVFASPLARANLHGKLVGAFTAKGPLLKPTVEGSFELKEAMLAGMLFERFFVDAKTDTETTHAALSIAQRDGGRLGASVDIKPEAPLKLNTRAEAFDLEFLSALASAAGGPAVALEGQLDGQLDAALGEEISLTGGLKIAGLRAVLPVDAPPIERGTLTLTAKDQQLALGLDARAGRGKLKLDTKLHLKSLDLQSKLTMKKVHTVAGGTVIQLNLDTGVTGGRRADGGYAIDVVLEDGLIRLPDESGESLAAIGSFDDLRFVDGRYEASAELSELFAKEAEPEVEAGPGMSVKIRTKNPLQISGDPIQALAEVDLSGESTPQGFSLSGRVWLDQGTLNLFSRDYSFERAQVLFDGQIPPSVNLDVLLSHEFNTMSLSLGVRGPVAEPKLSLTSKPAIYDQKQLMAFLLGADPDDDSGSTSAGQAGASAAANMLIAQLQRKLAKNMPIDTIKVDVADPDDPEAASSLTLGKWITRDLFLAYRIIPGASAGYNSSEGVARYRLLKRWMLEGVIGNAYNGSADVLWVRRW